MGIAHFDDAPSRAFELGHLRGRWSFLSARAGSVGIGLSRIVHDFDRPVPDSGNRMTVADGNERRQIELHAMVPAFGDDFRADAGRITDRDCNREIWSARHCRRP